MSAATATAFHYQYTDTLLIFQTKFVCLNKGKKHDAEA